MSDTNLSRVDAFLANLSSKQQQQPQPQRGSLIFAIDATGSREQTWDSAAELQVQMFKEAAVLGGIDVQLVYAACRALMRSVKPRTGSAIR